jgi:hypothetical protein
VIAAELSSLADMDPGEVLSALSQIDTRMRDLCRPEVRVLFTQGLLKQQQYKQPAAGQHQRHHHHTRQTHQDHSDEADDDYYYEDEYDNYDYLYDR